MLSTRTSTWISALCVPLGTETLMLLVLTLPGRAPRHRNLVAHVEFTAWQGTQGEPIRIIQDTCWRPLTSAKIAEVFGYAGDRKVALDTLMAAGGWSKDSTKPAYDENNEGIRRPVCDMILLAFHLVISVLM